MAELRSSKPRRLNTSPKVIGIQLKYLVAAVYATVNEELFDLPHQSANDISRHDVVKDVTRVEALLADGYANEGMVIVLSNDRSYWQPPARTDTVDAQFRLHDGRVLAGAMAWASRAGRGTTARRDVPLVLAGQYTCHWQDYSHITLTSGRQAMFRYLLIHTPAADAPQLRSAASTDQADHGHPPLAMQAAPPARAAYGTARSEILATARKLAGQSADGSFTLQQILTEMRRAGTRYTESTIRTHVT